MRIFIPPEDIAKRRGIKLSADKSRYLASVLRSRSGDEFIAIDGRGNAYRAEISEISKKDVFVNITGELEVNAEPSAHLVLCQGILKGEKMDMVVQKATELGVNEIIPLVTERCLVKDTGKAKRWAKIAEEAAEQCGRAFIPTVHMPAEFSSLLTAGRQLPIKGFIFWEEGGLPLQEAFRRVFPPSDRSCPGLHIHLMIGPEGGFTHEEIRLAEKHGFVRTTLGRRILRAETAAIVSAALVQFLAEQV